MQNEVITEAAALDLTDQLVGKPLTAEINGKKRQVGVIDTAEYVLGKGIKIVAEVTDERLAEQLNGRVLRGSDTLVAE
jgi:hypothetical protein